MTVVAYFIFIAAIDINVYRFAENYVEFWYQIPVNQVFALDELNAAKEDTIFKEYSYRLDIYNIADDDSGYFEGTKGALVIPEQRHDYFIDYIPAYLYPGEFLYTLAIETGDYAVSYDGAIQLSADTSGLFCSDLILGKKNHDENLVCHGYTFRPKIPAHFTEYDNLFTYMEIYGLIPDSLLYSIQYRIVDSLENIVFEHAERRIKYDFVQIDTCYTSLHNYIDGSYKLTVCVYDPSQCDTLICEAEFRVVTSLDMVANAVFYSDIQHLLSPEEYKDFLKLDVHEKKVYLKKFWSTRNYWEFEKRIIEVDAQLGTPFALGRDTDRGRIYIQLGPPEWIDSRSMEKTWLYEDLKAGARVGSPCQIWHYDGRGIRLLFCDTNKDGDFELLGYFGAHEEYEEFLKDHQELMGYFD